MGRAGACRAGGQGRGYGGDGGGALALRDRARGCRDDGRSCAAERRDEGGRGFGSAALVNGLVRIGDGGDVGLLKRGRGEEEGKKRFRWGESG